MGVRVFLGGSSVSGPASVADAVSTFERRLLYDFFEIAEFSGGAAKFEFPRAIDDCDSRGIVAAVFQLTKAFDHDRDNLFRADVADNPAHEDTLLTFRKIVTRRVKWAANR